MKVDVWCSFGQTGLFTSVLGIEQSRPVLGIEQSRPLPPDLLSVTGEN
jgi:hypothetical protein